ncbi:MAG: cytochrome C, partial [Deltaproteobacteria bacterium]|nr:cytochrome C [Deltaproteobacteria bacterium]
MAHARSAHARVACAECHIGHGAGWFVKSKLSGARQVYAVLADTYSRPIPPAISELRPARDTCEECHWPSKFFGHQYKKMTHYASTEDNRQRDVEILLKIGGADEAIERAEGIHMHMVNSGPIEYTASDEHLQEIPWVRYQRKNGDVSIYRTKGVSTDELPVDKEHSESVRRTVDCMDCHNRGAHHFRSPQISIDLELEANRIDRTLPYIKREAVAALVEPYSDEDKAMAEIEKRLT